MIYRCTKTGAMVSSNSQLSGSWELVEPKEPKEKKSTEKGADNDEGETTSS